MASDLFGLFGGCVDMWLRRARQKILFTSASLCMTVTSAFAEDAQRLYRSAHYLGRGDTGLATADGPDSIYYNPAGIAQGQGVFGQLIFLSPHLEFSDDARNMATELQDENADIPSILRKRVGKNQHIGLYNSTAIIFRRAALSVFNAQTTDILVFKSPESGGLEAVKARLFTNNGVAFSLAQDFMDKRLFIGTNIKYLHRGTVSLDANITDAESLGNMEASDLLKSGIGTSVDLGLIYKFKGLVQPSIAATVQNVGGTTFRRLTDEAPPPSPLKQIINLGFAIQPQSQMSKFKLLGEIWDITSRQNSSRFKKIHLGTELSVRDMIGFTAGLSEGWSSGGFYLDFRLLRLDAGIYIQEVSDRAGIRPDKRLMFKLTMGL